MIQIVRLFLVSAFIVLLVSCSKEQSAEDQRFLKTYTEILVERFRTSDTAIANSKIAEVIKNNGFTQETFKQEFFRYMNQDPKILRTLIDSANVRAKKIIQNDTSTAHY